MSIATAAIPMFDCREQYRDIEEEILEAVRGVLASGSLVLGRHVRSFEQRFARFLGVEGEGVGVGNGTDALAIALRALEVGPDDEVITVANTAIPTVSAIRMAGAIPVFCDVDPRTLLVDLDQLETLITPRTRAIVPVHLYGNAVDMPRLVRLARERGLAVVEDCAQATGTTIHGQMAGTWGDIGCFSFYPTKNLGAYGDGGLCFTRHPLLAEAMRQIRHYGCATTYHCSREGVNSRLDELQAAMLEVKLRHLSDYLARRRAVAAVYREHLSPRAGMPRVASTVDHSYHLFVVASERRDALAARLKAEEIGFGIHYPTPIHRMSGYRFLGYAEDSLPVTERLAQEVLSLPCYPELSHEAVRRICSVVNDVISTPA